MNARRTIQMGGLILAITLSAALAACSGLKSTKPQTESRSPKTLTSYRWTTDLRAESSLFDRSQAPEALRGAPLTIKAHAAGDRITPDRERVLTTVEPVAIEPRETIVIGTQRYNRISGSPWRVGGEAFPAARAYFGGTVELSARAFLEPEESPDVVWLQQELGSMAHREETVATGPARCYTLRNDQVTRLISNDQLNPFPVLKTLPAVRIDLWVDQQRNVIVGVRLSADTTSQTEAFVLDLKVTEIEPAGLTIEAPR